MTHASLSSSSPSSRPRPALPPEERHQRMSQSGGMNIKHPNFPPLNQADLPFAT